jgi:hypothetical protein
MEPSLDFHDGCFLHQLNTAFILYRYAYCRPRRFVYGVMDSDTLTHLKYTVQQKNTAYRIAEKTAIENSRIENQGFVLPV